ncbi:MAG TPA: hypothetical protein VJ065_03605 [Patescibacteria group bacterium]|nr:hypothetical protein [Patescibacteria group bacterium]
MQPDRRPEFRRIYPVSDKGTRIAERPPDVPAVNKKTLGSLARRFRNGVNVQANGQFALRSTSSEQVLTPIADIPIIATHQDGNGSINGGTSKEATRRAKRKVKRG